MKEPCNLFEIHAIPHKKYLESRPDNENSD